MRTIFFNLLLCLIYVFNASAANPKDSVVKVYTTANLYDYRFPWMSPSQVQATGSGFVVKTSSGETKIITNAHVVTNANFIQIRPSNISERFEVEVEMISHDCDLAVLKVKDKEFFRHITPLKFSSKSSLMQTVSVHGFPTGGEGYTVTTGVVSRIEPHDYAHSQMTLPAMQIDAAINPGNSGGPVINEDGDVVGVAFQGMLRASNIGYAIPFRVISHVLNNSENGLHKGFPSIGIKSQEMENLSLKKKYGVKNNSGILIDKVVPLSTAKDILEPGDVLLALDNLPIQNDGKMIINGNREDFSSYISLKKPDSTLKIKILRKNKKIEKLIKLSKNLHDLSLVGLMNYNSPKYLVHSGIVFQPLDLHFLFNKFFEKDMYPPPELLVNIHKNKETETQQVIVMSQILAFGSTAGYQNSSFTDQIVNKINGVQVRSLLDVKSALQKDTEFLTIELYDHTKVVIENKLAKKDHELINKVYAIHVPESL